MVKALGQVTHNLLARRYNNVGGKSSQDGQTSVISILCTSNFNNIQRKFMSVFLNWRSRDWSMDLTT